MFISPQDRGEMASMVYNWPSSEVDAVVVTDGSRVLGMGDLGIGGLGISIGKLDLYVAAGGFHPRQVRVWCRTVVLLQLQAGAACSP